LSVGHAYSARVIIPTYKSSYGETRVAQTSRLPEQSGRSWLTRSRGILEPDKNVPSPLLYQLVFMVGLTEMGLPSLET
jgi:hypothetical protein